MFNTTLILILLVSALSIFTGCGKGSGEFEGIPKTYSMDGAKIISPDIDDALNEKTMGQESYTLSPTRRLLLRFESLSNHVSKIEISKGRVVLDLALKDSKTMNIALTSLKVCPLTSNWMMAATWKRPHPRVKWETAGGDIDAAGCVKATNIFPQVPPPPPSDSTGTGSGSGTGSTKPVTKPSPSPTPIPSTTDVYFDMTQWFTDYPQARALNYGFIVIAEKEVTIYGDKSGSYSPRMHWKERY